MKTALIYSEMDNKLQPNSYSSTFREMFLALITELEPVLITSSCSVNDIDADAIIFFDPHSTHIIKIDGIKESKKLKYEFMDDPHQISMFGRHKMTGISFQKLGAGERIQRALERGINYIICPHRMSYYVFFMPYLGMRAKEMLLWFPCSPRLEGFPDRSVPISQRKKEILANGATWSRPTAHPYVFRSWAFQQPEVTFVPHFIKDRNVPSGNKYGKFLSEYAAALALCDLQVCPKHIQIPMAGCLCFVQDLKDYRELGFEDYKHCIYVNKHNFHDKMKEFLDDPESFQGIADTGRQLVETHYTATHFAKHIRRHIEEQLGK